MDQTPAPASDINGTPESDTSSLAALVAALKRIEQQVYRIAQRPSVAQEYVTPREAAAMLGIDVATFRKLVKQHNEPGPRAYVTDYGQYHVEDVRKWARTLPAKSFNPPPPPPKKAKGKAA